MEFSYSIVKRTVMHYYKKQQCTKSVFFSATYWKLRNNKWNVFLCPKWKIFRGFTMISGTLQHQNIINCTIICIPHPIHQQRQSFFTNIAQIFNYPSVSLELVAMNGPSVASFSTFSKSVFTSSSSFLPSFCSKYLSMQAWIL